MKCQRHFFWVMTGRRWNLREETYQKVVREGIPCSTLIPRRGAMETLKVVVYDCGADKVGTVTKNIR